MKELSKHIWNMQISVEVSIAHVAVMHPLTASAHYAVMGTNSAQHLIFGFLIFLGIHTAM